ncbi:hypothetical protein QBC46DRAFT_91574 [Diplogelasinospora grovesii]|uniref:CBF1-interacting co-repressor CIR N-terminal domain-containing protein n=1 Tax=Diplogelasinospora grovesii TaxID=303347 RepID=A0AAN6N9N1_9PEZI|nr:hypothetical protein QBC46DRAFT_91574 [Diplogelasinospora grovesii]
MPLHLLGKKSWNVYNTDNIARVRRDEAAAQAREEAEEQRMQEIDAARRLAILRGETPPPIPEEPPLDPLPSSGRRERDAVVGRKRKRHGEDDTDFEMRVARERAEAGDRAALALAPSQPKKEPSLVDHKGHISLFTEPVARVEKNPEAEKEAARKKRQEQDQYQMRFVNAAGNKDGDRLGLTDKKGPWYAQADKDALVKVPAKDVWGNEDPDRKVREAKRLDASDPLAMMKKGAAKVRELDKERKREAEERERAIKELEREERRRERKRRTQEEEDGSGDRERSRRRSRSRSRERRRHSEARTDHERERERRHSDYHRSSRSTHRSDHDRERHRSHSRHSHRPR